MPESRPEDFVAAADCYPHAAVIDKAKCAESTAAAERVKAKAEAEALVRSTAEWERDLAAFKAEKAAERAKATAPKGRP